MEIYLFIIDVFFGIAYVFLLIWLFRNWRLTPNLNPSDFDQIPFKTRLSVVIAARNEDKNIKSCIESVLSQNYPSELMEVLVVDDQSEDDTPEILEDIKDPRLKVMRLGVYKKTTIQGSKKKAIAYGVIHAQGDLIITTDADCIAGSQWVSTIVRYYETYPAPLLILPVEIVGSSSFLSLFQKLDSMSTFFIQKTAHDAGFFQLGSAANLAFEKKVYLESDPYGDNMQIASGDDLFLIKKVNQLYKKQTVVLKSTDAIVQTSSVQTLSEFISQRLRWSSKVKKAGTLSLMVVSCFVWCSKFFTFLSPAYFYIVQNMQFFWASIALLVLHLIADFMVLYESTGFFKKRKYLWYFLPMEIMYFVYLFTIGLLSWIPFQLEWKDRKINV
ncbi:MAG: glycosyltransferase [Saprospiraceae bacterium]|nr:glycosyltransferase [Saprospiraceae bacterium]